MHALQILYRRPGTPNLTCIFKDRPDLGIKYFKVKIKCPLTACLMYIFADMIARDAFSLT